MAISIGNCVLLLLGLVILGGWFFSGAAQTAAVQLLGGRLACG
jgi:hypothetical protein